MTKSGSSQPGEQKSIVVRRFSIRRGIPKSHISNYSRQSRFSMSNEQFREYAIGNRFRENGCIRRQPERGPDGGVHLNLPNRERADCL